MIFIVGSRGRLAQALNEQHAGDVVSLSRATYEHWGAANPGSEISDYFAAHAENGSVVYICSGLLAPRLPREHLHAVNFQLAQNIIRAVTPLGMRAVTFGRAMERTLATNPYVHSKLLLSQFVEESNLKKSSVLHIRIHTLYGSGEPSPFMFLGQLLSSLRTDTPLEMTLGRQLREYHHVTDDAQAIASLVENGVSGIVELSHGRPVTLRQLAEAIFQSLGKSHLLRLGAISEPAQENFSNFLEPPAALKGIEFRETVTSVVAYMKALVSA